MSIQSLLVVGTPQSGKKTLARGIQDLFHSTGHDPKTITHQISEEEVSLGSYQVDISTKYYTTSVDLLVSPSSLLADVYEPIPDYSIEGLMIVYDANHTDSFDNDVKRWGEVADAHDYNLRLCVANKIDLLDGQEEEWFGHRSEMIGWCLDHGFEFIEAEAIHHRKGLDERDKDGVPRIMEAMQSTLWSNIEMPGQSRNMQTFSMNGINIDMSNDISVDLSNIQLEQGKDVKISDENETEELAEKDLENKQEEQEEQDEEDEEERKEEDNDKEKNDDTIINDKFTNYFNNPKALENSLLDDDIDMGDTTTNKILQGIEEALSQVQDIRIQAKQEIEQQSEEADRIRRKRAEDMALKLMALLDETDL